MEIAGVTLAINWVIVTDSWFDRPAIAESEQRCAHLLCHRADRVLRGLRVVVVERHQRHARFGYPCLLECDAGHRIGGHAILWREQEALMVQAQRRDPACGEHMRRQHVGRVEAPA